MVIGQTLRERGGESSDGGCGGVGVWSVSRHSHRYIQWRPRRPNHVIGPIDMGQPSEPCSAPTMIVSLQR